jgi:hypothetical protein
MGKFIRLMRVERGPVVLNTDYIVKVYERGAEGRAAVCLDAAAIPSWDVDTYPVEEKFAWLQGELIGGAE